MLKWKSCGGFSLLAFFSLIGCIETAPVERVRLPQGTVSVQYWDKALANNGIPYYTAVVNWKMEFSERERAAITAIEMVSGCSVNRKTAVFGKLLPNSTYPDKVTATVSC